MAPSTISPPTTPVVQPKKSPAEGLIEPEILAKLDPSFVKYFTEVLAVRPTTHQIPIDEIRRNPIKYASPWNIDTTGRERVFDRTLIADDGATFPVKLYYPDPTKHGAGPYAVHINYHGDAQLCLTMCEGAGLVIVDVNYRHCPEAPWGKGVEDSWAALRWVRDSGHDLNINSNSISIGGISAGAFYCFILQHLARDHGIPLKLCIPSVGGVTDAMTWETYVDSPYPSFHEFHKAPCLNWARLAYFGELCFPRDKLPDIRDRLPDWWLAPIKAQNWNDLCDSFIITAECDPLRDEAESYGMKLIAGGNKVQFKRYLGVPHPFMHIKVLKQAQDYDKDINAALKAAHGI